MSKNCRDAERLLFEYLDGELGWFRRWRIRRHLRRCPPCQDGFSFEDRLLRKIERDCAEDTPEELWNRVKTLIRQNGATDTPAGPAGGGPDV